MQSNLQPEVSQKLNNVTTIPVASSSSSFPKKPQQISHHIGHDRHSSVQLKIEASHLNQQQWTRTNNSFVSRFLRMLRYLASQLVILLSQLSPIVQSFSSLIILLYLVQFAGDITVDFFALMPGEIISPGQWYHTVIAIWSHAFLETSFITLFIDLLVLSFCGTLIEPLWGHRELLRFMMVTIIPSSLITSIHYIILYCITFDESNLFNVRINGLSAFCAAVTVTVKQLLPQSILISTSFGRLKNDHLPFTITIILIILYLVNVLKGVQLMLFLYGLLCSFIYLRFWQIHVKHTSLDTGTTINTRGDLSESFALDTFFPNVLRPLVCLLSNHSYRILVRMHLCPKRPFATSNPMFQTLSQVSVERESLLAPEATQQQLTDQPQQLTNGSIPTIQNL